MCDKSKEMKVKQILLTPFRYIRTLMAEMEERGVLGVWCIALQLWIGAIVFCLWISGRL